jgi:cation diffusion facilitator family transporter
LSTTAHTHDDSHAGHAHGPVAEDSHGHAHDIGGFVPSHEFTDSDSAKRESALTWVTVITFVTMIIELIAGYWSGSLALTADGWHMGTHAVALGGAALAYRLSKKAANHAAYAFGGWKIEVLSGYSSGLLLMAVALWLIFDSVRSLLYPGPIDYEQALIVAFLGLVVNLASAWLLSRGGDGHGHAHGHAHGHSHGSPKPRASVAAFSEAAQGHLPGLEHAHAHAESHDASHDHAHDAHGHDHDHDHGQPTSRPAPKARDINFNAAYVHVLADLFTSVLAVLALCGGMWFGWRFLDPVVALLGAAVIGNWSIGVLRDSAKALVDASSDASLVADVKSTIESDGDAQVVDLHVWQVGTTSFAAILCIVADNPLTPDAYRAKLAAITELRHVTVEVNQCPAHALGSASKPLLEPLAT